ncbi:MAG TPA: hypothetical protein VIK86_00435 [Candidatus Paceibacterota bacterium]
MKKIVIPNQFKIGLMLFIAINIAIKLIECKIAKNYDYKIAILLMFLFSFIVRFLMILIYDYTKKDWLLIEYLKEKLYQKQEMTVHTSVTRKILKLKKIGNWFLFIGLVCTDPVVTILYYRDGHHIWNKIPKKNLNLFFISELICTLTLAATIYSIIGLINLIF